MSYYKKKSILCPPEKSEKLPQAPWRLPSNIPIHGAVGLKSLRPIH